MKYVSPILFALTLSTLIAGQGSQPNSQAQPIAGAEIKNLIKRQLANEFTPGREVLVDYVTIKPNTTLERHWHPGEEFHYYLEGEPTLAIDGKAPTKMKPGTVGHVPYKAVHVLSTKDKGAKLLVFRVHSTGQPMRHLVGKGGLE